MQKAPMVEPVSNSLSAKPDNFPCPWCGEFVTLIWVHGHGQCPGCGINVDECCRGEQCQGEVRS